jgi:uncharacterized membrane protein
MPEQTVDVLMGGYLSKQAAREDFESVRACGVPLMGLVVMSKDLDGTLEIEQHDHIVKEASVALGGAGFVVGLFAPPILVATAVGAAVGAGLGKMAEKKVGSELERQAEASLPIGGAGLIVIYEHEHAAAIEAAVDRPIKRVVGQATAGHREAVKAALADAQAKMTAGNA